jgi:hypothetical protein
MIINLQYVPSINPPVFRPRTSFSTGNDVFFEKKTRSNQTSRTKPVLGCYPGLLHHLHVTVRARHFVCFLLQIPLLLINFLNCRIVVHEYIYRAKNK